MKAKWNQYYEKCVQYERKQNKHKLNRKFRHQQIVVSNGCQYKQVCEKKHRIF